MGMRPVRPPFRAKKFTWTIDDLVVGGKRTVARVSLSAAVLEFYNKCNSSTDGKFCDTAGGNKKGASETKKAAASKASKKILATEASDGTVKVKAGTSTPVVKAKITKTAAPKKAGGAESKKATQKKSAADETEKKVVTVSKKTAEKSEAVASKAKPKAKAAGDPDLDGIPDAVKNKPMVDMTPAELKAAAKALSKGPLKTFELDLDNYSGTDPHGSVYDTNTDNFHSLKKGQSLAEAIAIVKEKNHPVDESDESRRVSALAESRISKLNGGSVKDTDTFNGEGLGMNELPPPSGVNKTHNLTDDNISAMIEYRGDGFAPINSALRGQKKASAAVKELTADLDDAFLNGHVTTKDIVVYRGMNLSQQKKVGGGFRDDGFTSTTYSPDATSAYLFGSDVIKIVVPKGTPVLKMSGGAGKGDKHPGGESELLLNRGGTYTEQPDGSYRVTYD